MAWDYLCLGERRGWWARRTRLRLRSTSTAEQAARIASTAIPVTAAPGEKISTVVASTAAIPASTAIAFTVR